MNVIINLIEGNDIFDLILESDIGWFAIIGGYLIWVIVFMFIFMFIFTLINDSEKNKQLLQKPEIVQIGTFDGCNVSYVNRGYQVNSFYIAKCNNTETRTTIEQHPKSGTKITTTIVEK
jgi:hypothetical protein